MCLLKILLSKSLLYRIECDDATACVRDNINTINCVIIKITRLLRNDINDVK